MLSTPSALSLEAVLQRQELGITQAILSSKTDSFGLQKSTKEGFLNYQNFQAIHTVIICGDLYWICWLTWMEHV
ncbi:hypothetical protein DPMN_114694 [Dreissena polymorpha]|uniref:Uncharacterized protein n=1 Tax=Dreissena polymorpha TaxID=45954 RepID=A0A9D4KJW7_DREPO|nr:hypothetical protein DPMN_114694 [Dreissena polymorpha]